MTLKRNVCFIILGLLLSSSIFAVRKKPVDLESCIKYEYDISKYQSGVQGMSYVYINKENPELGYVELEYYSTMYKLLYFITIEADKISGYCEKLEYKRPNSSANAKLIKLEDFACTKDSLESLSEQTKSAVKLTLELFKKTKKYIR